MGTHECHLLFCECRWGVVVLWGSSRDTSTLHVVIELIWTFCTQEWCGHKSLVFNCLQHTLFPCPHSLTLCPCAFMPWVVADLNCTCSNWSYALPSQPGWWAYLSYTWLCNQCWALVPNPQACPHNLGGGDTLTCTLMSLCPAAFAPPRPCGLAPSHIWTLLPSHPCTSCHPSRLPTCCCALSPSHPCALHPPAIASFYPCAFAPNVASGKTFTTWLFEYGRNIHKLSLHPPLVPAHPPTIVPSHPPSCVLSPCCICILTHLHPPTPVPSHPMSQPSGKTFTT